MSGCAPEPFLTCLHLMSRVFEPSEEEVIYRVATYLQKHGNSATSEDMWGVFGSDEGVAPFLKRRGGSCHWCRQHPGIFTVEGNVITLIGQVRGFAGGGGGGINNGGGYSSSSSSRAGRGSLEPSEDEVRFRVATYLQKHGNSATSEDMWEVLGSDEGLAPFFKRRGGSCKWCREHPDLFLVEGNVITLVGEASGFMPRGGGGGGGGGHVYEPAEDEVIFRVANYVQKHGGSVTSEDMWEVFGGDEGVAPFLKRRGGSCHWCRQHPGIFSVEGNVISTVGYMQPETNIGVSLTSRKRRERMQGGKPKRARIIRQ